MTIYLDNCCLNRPYDDQTAPRVRLEAEAIEMILAAVVNLRIKLLWSEVLDTENEQNPFAERRIGVARWKDCAAGMVLYAAELSARARALTIEGLKSLDALHVASAVTGGASHFLTVDDGILRRRERVREIVIVSPLEFVQIFGESL